MRQIAHSNETERDSKWDESNVKNRANYECLACKTRDQIWISNIDLQIVRVRTQHIKIMAQIIHYLPVAETNKRYFVNFDAN